MKNLIVVESPSKAKTIKSFLKNSNNRWEVTATLGYITDLPKNEMGVYRKEEKISGKWVYQKGKKQIIQEIAQKAKDGTVYIATDDDREGEKIASDVIAKTKIENSRIKRIVFHEITSEAIKRAIENSRQIDSHIVKAAVARRFIHREVGYKGSRMLRFFLKKENVSMKNYPSIGHSISPTLSLICEAEERIKNFVPEHYKQISIRYVHNGKQFHLSNSTQFKDENEEELESILSVLRDNREHPHIVKDYVYKTKNKPPPKPFVTSTLQRACSYILGLRPEETMKIAQKMYEGIDLGDGIRKGLITYMRTDSYRISDEAFYQMVTLLSENFGEDYTLEVKRNYKSKPGAQEAHEAIRPVDFSITPNAIGHMLERDTFRVYQLIYYRTLATQMVDAVYDDSEIEVEVSGTKLKKKANVQLFDGWEKLTQYVPLKQSDIDPEDKWKEEEIFIPEVAIGEEITPVEVMAIRKKTKRPWRYGIGRLIEKIDDLGIARPSTLHSIIGRLENMGAVQIKKNMIYPTVDGEKTNAWVAQHCPWLIDIEENRKVEQTLDEIETGKLEDTDGFVGEYFTKMEDLAEKIGYVEYEDMHPSQAQIELAEDIAHKKGLHVADEIFKNRKKMEIFLKNNIEEPKGIAKCPECKKGHIRENQKAYGCSRYKDGCRFTLWKNGIESFFEHFSYEIKGEMLREVVEGALKKKPLLLSGLVSKQGKKFEAKIVLKKHEKYGWQLALSFPKNKKGS